MSDMAALLKREISRLSRKEVRTQLRTIKSVSAAHRRQMAALKRQVSALEKELSRLRRDGGAAPSTSADTAEGEEAKRHRFVAKGLRSLRARLELSAEDFGRLVGVSGQSIYNWEREKAVPRASQVEALAKVRALGKREAKARLEQMTAEAG